MPTVLCTFFIGCEEMASLKSGFHAVIHSNSPTKSIAEWGVAPHLSPTFVNKSQSDTCFFLYAVMDAYWVIRLDKMTG